jgi:rSAM/selenodomain-associated transferase 2
VSNSPCNRTPLTRRNILNTNDIISIIIPALNEAGSIERAIASTTPSVNTEVIVVDGGSVDDTMSLAQNMGAKVISSPAGRADQMNLGAQAATGDILLFLHADTGLPPEFDILVRAALASGQRRSVAGAFPLKIDGDSPQLRWVEWGVNGRSHFFQMPYGDQALFLRADTFHEIGGFPALPIMEDFELVRRLKRLGKIAIVSAPVVTSGRRWLERGVLATTVINQMVILGYFLGVNGERLRQLYRPRK